MGQEISGIGVGISIIFAFLRWAFPTVPKPIAWSGVTAGALLILVGISMPQLNFTPLSIGSFLAGCVLIGAAVHLAMRPNQASKIAASAQSTRQAFSSRQKIIAAPLSLDKRGTLHLGDLADLVMAGYSMSSITLVLDANPISFGDQKLANGGTLFGANTVTVHKPEDIFLFDNMANNRKEISVGGRIFIVTLIGMKPFYLPEQDPAGPTHFMEYEFGVSEK